MSSYTSLEPLTTTALVPHEADVETRPPASTTLKPFSAHMILAGVLVIVVLFATGWLWSAMAPLNSAIVASGIVEVASHRKTIQHLEGGVVDAILVRDGDLVEAGQSLVKLREVGPAAELAQLEGQILETIAVIARLMAAQSGAPKVVLPAEFGYSQDAPALQPILEGQQQIFDSQRQLDDQRLSVFREQVAQTEETIKGLRVQIEAGNLQRDLLQEELARLAVLEAKQLIPRTRVLVRRQELARVEGDLGAFQAEIAQLKKSMSEAELQLSELRAGEIVRANIQLREERARYQELSHRATAARDVLGRTTITSPIDGEVVNMRVHTSNGVIAGGEPIMDIVPLHDQLVVRALINPNDVDEVAEGMPADVRLTSAARRSRMPIEGVVTDLSPDRVIDRQTGSAFYEARVEFAPAADGSEEAREMMVGMGADVFIRTGERSAMQYLLAPISRKFELGLREK